MEMRITYDKEADVAYIYFKDIKSGEVVRTISLNESINIDLDAEGRTIGIEILDASKNMPKNVFASAQIIG